MKALALIALAIALEAGFLFTVAVPADDLAAWRRSPAARAEAARLVHARPPAPAPVPARS